MSRRRKIIWLLLVFWLLGGWMNASNETARDRRALAGWSLSGSRLADALRDGYLDLTGENRAAWQVLVSAEEKPYRIVFQGEAQFGDAVEIVLRSEKILATFSMPAPPCSGEGTVSISQGKAVFAWAGQEISASLDEWPTMIIFDSQNSNLKLRRIRLIADTGKVLLDDNFRVGHRLDLKENIAVRCLISLLALIFIWLDGRLLRRFGVKREMYADTSGKVVALLLFMPAAWPGPLTFDRFLPFLLIAGLGRYLLLPRWIGMKSALAEANENKAKKLWTMAPIVLGFLACIPVWLYSMFALEIMQIALVVIYFTVLGKEDIERQNGIALIFVGLACGAISLLPPRDFGGWVAMQGNIIIAVALPVFFRPLLRQKKAVVRIVLIVFYLALLIVTAESVARQHPDRVRFLPPTVARWIGQTHYLFYLDKNELVQTGGPLAKHGYGVIDTGRDVQLPAEAARNAHHRLLVLGSANAGPEVQTEENRSYVSWLQSELGPEWLVFNDSAPERDLFQKSLYFRSRYRESTTFDALLIEVGTADTQPLYGLVRPTQAALDPVQLWQRSRALLAVHLWSSGWRTGLLHRYGSGGIIDIRPAEDAGFDLAQLLDAAPEKTLVVFLDPSANTPVTPHDQSVRSQKLRTKAQRLTAEKHKIWLDANDLLAEGMEMPTLAADPSRLNGQGMRNLAELIAKALTEQTVTLP